MPAPLPATLSEWRHWSEPDTEPRDVWTPLEPWLEGELGYRLFASDIYQPPSYQRKHKVIEKTPYAANGFAYLSPHWTPASPPLWGECVGTSTTQASAYDRDGRAVVIQLVVKGGQGRTALKAWHRLATSPISLMPANHVLPILAEHTRDDMHLLVFPLVGDEQCDVPWFHSFDEVVDFCKQVFEGIAFCHERLVAHRDLSAANFLYNVLGFPRQGVQSANELGVYPYRSLLPFRYYLIDFELAIAFDEDTPSSERLVSGLPASAAERRGKYNRTPAPEMLTGERYCPFKADIFYIGIMLSEDFDHLGHLSPELVSLIARLCDPSAEKRPTASEALTEIKSIERKLSLETLRAAVPKHPELPERQLIDLPI